MKINNIKINGFGKLENKEINLSEHINLIYGKNETGKTTLLKFISGMFYGIPKNKNKKEFPDFEMYKPWQTEEFSGKLKYTLDNNESYEVFREFSKKNPKIYKNAEDVSKNFNIDKTKGNEFFYEQTGMDETMFLSTTLIEQKNVVLDNNEQSVLTQKITNILSSGEENISYKKTKELLNKKLIEEVGSERTVGRPINVINGKLQEIRNKQNMIEINSSQLENVLEEKNKIKNKINEKNTKINLIKEIKIIKNKNNLEKEKIKINKNIQEEEKIKINALENKINENKIIKNKINLFNLIILFILIAINIILFIFNIDKIINITLIILNVAYAGFLILKKIINNKKNHEKYKINKKYLSEIENIKNNIEQIQKNINKINEEQIKKNNLDNNQIINTYKNKIDKNEIEYLLNENSDEINSILENLENEIATLKLQLHTNEIDYNNILNKIEEKAQLEEKLVATLEEKEDILKLEKCINIAKIALENAYDKMKNEITPKFTKNLSNIVGKISNEKYNNIKFIDGQGLIVELENGEYVNANKLSIGTIDQLYLSLRLSAIQEITKEKMPIILDEAFAYYDNERLENILKYLNENYKENQIIIFTCSNREREIFEKNDIKYNYINL